MNFEPTNRHILITPKEQSEEQETNSLIVLPQDYKKPESPYLLGTVKRVSSDSKFFSSLKENDCIVVERRMLQKIEVDKSEFYLILDNYVLGRIKHEN